MASEPVVHHISAEDLDALLGNEVPTLTAQRRNAVVQPMMSQTGQDDSESPSTFVTGIEDEAEDAEATTSKVKPKRVARVDFKRMPSKAALEILSAGEAIKPAVESDIGISAELLLQNITSDTFWNEENDHKVVLPGGLGMNLSDINKYFGVEARKQFFGQQQTLRHQRHILSTDADAPVNPDLVEALTAMNESLSGQSVSSFGAERPTPTSVAVHTRVVIRTQSLALGESFEQMKLVPKPEGITFLEKEKPSDSDSDSFSSDEEANANFDAKSPLNSQSFLRSLRDYGDAEPKTLSLRDRSNLSIAIPTQIARGKQQAKANNVPSKLKPLMRTPQTHKGNRKPSSASSSVSFDSAGLISPSGGSVVTQSSLADSTCSSAQSSARSPDRKSNTLVPLAAASATQSSPLLAKNIAVHRANALTTHNKNDRRSAAHQSTHLRSNDTESVDTEDPDSLASLYKNSVAAELRKKHQLLKQKSKALEIELSSDVGLELVCIDHRNAMNQKVRDRLGKSSSLFKYVEAQAAKIDFYSKDLCEVDNMDADIEIDMWAPQSKMSPARNLPKLLSPLRANNQRTTQRSKSKTRTGSKSLKTRSMSEDSTSFGSPPHPSVALSPRSRFIDSCIRQNLNPRASLLLRKSFTREMNLRHLGMGDDIAVLFAEAIVSVPYIERLNVCDNNLADRGLSAIVDAICHMQELVHLDMSMNEIGPNAALALNNYLRRDDCPLVSLLLRKADVDDDECRDFVQALEHNTRLRTLDLSENLVGSSENLNTVLPDIVTGGEALADLLSHADCPLTTLRLGWNLLRLDGAMSLCASLGVNVSLTFLELSYNSLGAAGGVALGDALQENKTLQTLLISNNSLDSIACLTICAGILENEALKEVSFDGNPIGEQGAKVLMLLPTIVGSRVAVSARTCNTTIRDSRNWFDTSSLVRKFELDLSLQFERAIAILLLYLVPSHQTYIVAQSEYYDPDAKSWIDLKLTETVDKNYLKKRPLEPEQLAAIASLKVVKEATKDIQLAKELFESIDEDGSGQLDQDEFENLMAKLGMDTSGSKVQEVMAEYDVDGGGVIELAEFLIFLKNQRKLADKRLKELTEFPIVTSEVMQPDQRYVPPRVGKLRITIVDGFTQKESYRVISPGDRVNILKVAEQSGELLQMTSFGMSNYKVRLDEALVLAHQLLKETNNKVKVLATLLPQMSTPQDARGLVTKLLDGNQLELTRLKREVGQAFRVLMGQPDGFYCLDLSNDMDRFCVNRLLEISMTTQYRRSTKRDALGYGKLGDTSQHGNFSCFRNEIFNKKPIVVSVEFASPLPRTGKLEFDFVSQRRFGSEGFILNDIRFSNLLIKSFLLTAVERPKLISHLLMIRKHCDRVLENLGKPVWEPSLAQANEIGLMMEAFYENLDRRVEQLEKYRSKENIKTQWEYDPAQLQLDTSTASIVYSPPYLYKDSAEKFGAEFFEEESNGKDRGIQLSRSPQRRSSIFDSVPSKTTTAADASRSDRSDGGDNAVTVSIEHLSELMSPVDAGSDTVNSSRMGTAREFGSPRILNIKSFEEAEEEIGEFGLQRTDQDDDDFNDDFELAERPIVDVLAKSTKPATGPAGAPTGVPSNKLRPRSFIQPARAPVLSAEQLCTQEAIRKVQSASKDDGDGKGAKPLNEVWNRYVCLMGSRNLPAHAKAAKTLELLLDQFETNFIYARHLEMLVLLFKDYGSLHNSDDFGTYRVDLIVQLFSCVVDLHNFEIVLRQLTSFEIACVRCRLGMLNLFNPMKPEGSLELSLSRREERQIVKMLAQLSVVEPGDNLPFVQFRWERDMAPMPGYELTEPWLTEDGLPKKGFWNVTYYAGEGKGLKGGKPVPKLRRAMLQLVLIDEDELITEAERDAEVAAVLSGTSFIKSNPNIWFGYLAFDEAEAKAIKEKKAAAAAEASKRR